MAERKPLSKKLRFEIFKRDSFTCQYCGRKAPDVVLEVDHIHPVSKGGKNELMNLVTSCRDCNRGKGKRKLSDNSEVLMQRKQLEELNQKREQMRMMLEWKAELQKFQDEQVSYIEDYFMMATGVGFTEKGRQTCIERIKIYGIEEVYESMEIALCKYYNDTKQSAVIAWDKVGGICYNRKKMRERTESNSGKY